MARPEAGKLGRLGMSSASGPRARSAKAGQTPPRRKPSGALHSDTQKVSERLAGRAWVTANVAQLVEHLPGKQNVAGSTPVICTITVRKDPAGFTMKGAKGSPPPAARLAKRSERPGARKAEGFDREAEDTGP